MITNSNHKKSWSYIKSLKQDQIFIYCKGYSNNFSKAEALNKQFKFVITRGQHESLLKKGPSPHAVMHSKLNVYKATGLDGISARILKEMHCNIALIQKIIFDCSFLQINQISMDMAKALDTVPY